MQANMGDGTLQLSYGQVETLLASMLRVHDAHASKLAARFKDLRRLGFPEGVNITRGRFPYDFEAILKSLLAFQLIDAFMPTPQAVATLRGDWQTVSKAARRSVALVLPELDRGPRETLVRPSAGPFLLVTTAAKVDWSSPPGDVATLVQQSSLMVCSAEGLGEKLATAPGSVDEVRPAPCRIVLDLYLLVEWITRTAIRAGWTTRTELEREVRPGG